MDTSKEYVIMRIKAKDDLDWGQTAIGLHRVIIYENDKYTICSDENANFFVLHSEYGLFQLERQDQLQEMIFYNKNDKSAYLRSMYLNIVVFNGFVQRQAYLFSSMEQLWLAFVMKEKYNKIWNGENWKEINDGREVKEDTDQ